MVGKTIGHYQVLAELGTGGMGVVYRARDLRLGREVALKFLPVASARDKTSVERFEREARAAAGINHPNICTVHEVDDFEGSPFIAMELLDGKPLKAWLSDQPVPLETMLDWAIQISDGLSAAHERQIVHRDIKPGNLFITSRGHAKILDFGLAKQSPPFNQAPATEIGAQNLITDPGLAPGTPNYMSPEQVRGLALDCRTDLFSFGAVLYEMATGKMLFSGATTGAVVGAILHEPPDLAAVQRMGKPAELERIIGKALEKDRDLRYHHATEIGADLKRLRRDTQSGQSLAISSSAAGETVVLAPASSTAPKQKSKIFVALVSAAILAMVAVGAYYAVTRRGSEGFLTMSIQRLTNVGEVRKTAISADGKYLAFTAGDQNQPSLWVRQLATGSDLQILPAATGSFAGITFSADDNYIYYVRYLTDDDSGQLFRVATLGGSPRRILGGIDSTVTLSPDGRRVAFLRQTGSESETLMVAGIDGGEQALVQRTAPDMFGSEGVSWSPDSKVIAAAAYSGGKCYIMTIPAGGGRLQPVGIANWQHIRQLAWMPDDSGVVFIAMQTHSSPGQIWGISYPGGKSRRITNDLDDYVDLSLAGDSRTLVAVQGNVNSHLWKAPGGDASRATQITFGNGTQDGVDGLEWTVSGRIVYASLSGGTRELWTMENGAPPRPLTSGADLTYYATPSACPDGRTVVYGSGQLGMALIWRIDFDNQKPTALISSGTTGGPSCSPDGKWVYYNALSKYYSLWRVPLNGGTPDQLTNFPSVYPRASPDGKWIAYLLADPNRSAIGIIPAGGGPSKTFDISRSSPGGYHIFRWSPAGDGIDYVDTRNGVSNIWRQSLDAGKPRQITNFNSDLIFNFVWLPDGKDLAVARGGATSDVVEIQNFGAMR